MDEYDQDIIVSSDTGSSEHEKKIDLIPDKNTLQYMSDEIFSFKCEHHGFIVLYNLCSMILNMISMEIESQLLVETVK